MTTEIERLRSWLAGLHEVPVIIDDDIDLIESGLVTSLQFVSMVMEIERLHGSRLEPGVITIEKMRTLRAIDAAVFRSRTELTL
ncbi:phosphopantetheine-binding protein [Nocardia sp. NBC_01377]|uniref:phosphopantetheine-binding protein n=1 Tax=Nocardia sp. NBC_01377 TaxID=2903595 RepID=UPI00324726B5